MATPVIMPKFSMTQETGTVVAWLVQEGAVVAKGDPIMEVETDKVTMEVEAPQDGVLRGLLVKAGDVVPVTGIIAYILAEGEAWTELQHATSVAATPAVDVTASTPKATPVAQRIAAANELDLARVPAPENGRRIRRAHVEAFLQQAEPPPVPGKVRATPAARRLARQRGLDLAQIGGSGPHGRVQAQDIASATAPGPPVAPVQPVPEPVAADELLPVTRMRRTIADRLSQSYRTIPHITLTVAVDMTAVHDLRRRLNEQADREGGTRVSVTAVVAKVCAWALGRHPLLNASWGDDGIRLHRQVNMGIAVALDHGLIVPVIPNAAACGLLKIATRLQELSMRARTDRLQPQDVQGGTFTISNLGMLGVDQFTAIINQPQSAILAVGRTAKQAVVVETAVGDDIVIRPMMQLTLSVDHRLVDGATAARFLQDVVAGLEEPDRLLW